MTTQELNLYLVVSEELSYVECEDWFNIACHREYYRIAEMVVAKSHAQAKWLAWRNDNESWTGDVRDMPKFAVRKKGRAQGPPRIVTREYDTEETWHLWDVGDAPHIGIGGVA